MNFPGLPLFMAENELVLQVASDHGIELNKGQGIENLGDAINTIINSDFNRLIAILYRMDINETKLREMLAKNTSSDAGILIARLMVDRHIKKIADRARYSNRNKTSDEEKW